MAEKDADLATAYIAESLFLVDEFGATLELGEVPAYDNQSAADSPVLYVVDQGAFDAGAVVVDPGPPVLSELDTDQGGVGFGIRTTKARG